MTRSPIGSLQKFQAALEALTPGDPLDATTTLGPLCSEAALLNLLDQVKRSVAAGARLLLGGGRVNRTGAFMQPSILTDIKKGTPAYVEEFFGPVALFFRVPTRMKPWRLPMIRNTGWAAPSLPRI